MKKEEAELGVELEFLGAMWDAVIPVLAEYEKAGTLPDGVPVPKPWAEQPSLAKGIFAVHAVDPSFTLIMRVVDVMAHGGGE